MMYIRQPQKYKHLDVLIYNPGAIWWASVQDTPMKRFRLMQQVNVEGLYGAVQAALPHLKKASSSSSSLPLRRRGGGGGRIVVVSPPIYSRFFRGKTAYAMGKVAMSVLTKGLGMDFERQGLVGQEGGEGGGRGMAITSLWPAVVSQVKSINIKLSFVPNPPLSLYPPLSPISISSPPTPFLPSPTNPSIPISQKKKKNHQKTNTNSFPLQKKKRQSNPPPPKPSPSKPPPCSKTSASPPSSPTPSTPSSPPPPPSSTGSSSSTRTSSASTAA